MGRFLPPAPFREEYGCVRNSTAASGLCVTLGRKLKTDEPIETQFCEDNIIEQPVGSEGLVVGVFDGHGGHQCSRVASEQLVASVAQLMGPDNGLNSDSLVSAFRRVDEDWCTGTFLEVDESGTTATLGVIQGQRLTIAHVGDTRAVRIRKDGEVLTTSHRASNAVERERIIARGGDIPEYSDGECARVNGLIEVTRSLGDRWLKPVLDCTPEVVVHDITADDAFLVIGSDGLFDCVDDDTVARFVTKEAKNGKSHYDIAFALAKLAYRNGSTDDISAYVLSLDFCGREVPLDHTQVNVPCSNGASLHSEPIVEPQTPVLHDTLNDPIVRPPSHGSLDDTACTSMPDNGKKQTVSTRWPSLVRRSLKWGACAVAVAGLVVFQGNRCG